MGQKNLHNVSKTVLITIFCLIQMLYSGMAYGQRKMEKLGRGVVATRTAGNKILVSWRLLGTEPQNIGFNVYRSVNGGTPVKLNGSVLYEGTNFEDISANTAAANTYYIKSVSGGVEKEAGTPCTLPANTLVQPYLKIPIRNVPDFKVVEIHAGDLDGDGEFDFVMHRDPMTDLTKTDIVEAYKSDGTYLWTMDLGPNSLNRDHIRPGSSALNQGHGDNITVYDINCDGKAEVILHTANGVKFADGNTVVDANNDKQFISVVNGFTGRELSRTLYNNPYPQYGPSNGHMGIAYLDGIHPSLVWEAANRNTADGSFKELVTAWDWNGSTLVEKWVFDLPKEAAKIGKIPSGHQFKLYDLDGDGKDEVIPFAYALNSDGTMRYNLYQQTIDHGDRFVISDLDPSRPGLEMYGIQQGYSKQGIMWYYCDASTGKILLSESNPSNRDMARGMAGDFDPRYNGHELYTYVDGLYNVSGALTSTALPAVNPNIRIWWDGDLASEIMDEGKIVKWNYINSTETRLFTLGSEATQNGGNKPPFYGDILGDWREEAIFESSDHNYLIIYTTPYYTTHRIYTLPHNPGYRNDMTVKGYVTSHNPDFYLGFGMKQPPVPSIQTAGAYWVGNSSSLWDHTNPNWSDGTAVKTFADGDTIMFDLRGNSADTIRLNTTAAPGKIWAMNPEGKNYVIAGSGKLTGALEFWKARKGSFTLAGIHDYTGETFVTEGQFNIDGSLQSKVTVKGLGALGGQGTLNGGVVLESGLNIKGGKIAPGFGNTSEKLGTITVAGNLAVGGDNTFEFDVVPGSAKINDSLIVIGNLTFTGTNRLVVNFAGNNYAPGVYTLLRSLGTLSASAVNFKVEGVSGVSNDLLIENNEVKIRINATRSPASVVWTGSEGSSWDFDTQNFKAGNTPTAFVSGDALTFDSTAVQRSLVLNETVYPASVTFNGDSSYTLQGTGNIGGTTDIIKNDSGNLSLLGTGNTYTGKTIVNGGTLTVAKLGFKNEPSSIGAADSAAANIQITNATLVVNEKSTTDRDMTINGMTTINIPDADNYAIFDADITGPGSLVKTGPGSIFMVGAKTFSGPVVIKSGTIYLRTTEGNVDGLGTSKNVTIEDATLVMEDIRGSGQASWNLTVPAGKNATLVTDGRSTLLGSLFGGGTLNVNIPFIRTDFKGNWSQFTGKINVADNDFRIANTFGYANAAINLKSGKMYAISGASSSVPIPVGELTGVAATSLGADISTANWVIGAKNTDATFAGSILKSSLTKVGTGTFTVTGDNVYTGTTTVNAGRLLVNNKAGIRGIGSGSVTVANGGVLGGTGFVKGAITVNAGGKLQPGSNGIGTFTDSTSVTFASGAIAEMQINKTSALFDVLKVTGSIAFNGKLVINKTDTAGFVGGDAFRLFEATSYSGNFSSIEPAVPGTGLTWDTTELRTNGTLKVAGGSGMITKTYFWRGTAGSTTTPSLWSSGTNWSTTQSGTDGSPRTTPAVNDILVFDGSVLGTNEYFVGNIPTETIGTLRVINGAKVTFYSSVYPTTAITDAFTTSVYGGSTYSVTGTTGSFANLKPGDVITTASGITNPMPYAQVLAILDGTHMTVSKETNFPTSAQSKYYLAPTLYTENITVDAASTLNMGASGGNFFSLVLNTKGGTVAGTLNFLTRGGHDKLVCTTPNTGSNTAGLHFTSGSALNINTSTSSKWNYNLGSTLGLYKNGKFIFNDGGGNNNITPGYEGDAGIVFEAGSTFTMGAGENNTPFGPSHASTGELTYTPAVAFKSGSKYVNNSSRISAPYMIVNDENVSYPNLEFQVGFPTNLTLRKVENLTVSGTSAAAVNTGTLLVTGDITNATANAINFGNVMMGGSTNQTIGGAGAVSFGTLNIADKAEVTLAKNISTTNVHLLGKLNFGSNTITGNGTFATYSAYSKEATTSFALGSSAISGINNTGAGTLVYEYPVGSSVSNPNYLPARTIYRSYTGNGNGVLSAFATAAAAGQTATFSIEGASYTTSGAGLQAAAPGFSYLLDVNGMKDQTITFAALAQKEVGVADFNAGATASSGLPVSYTSTNTNVATVINGLIHIVGAGTTTITSSQSGNNNYKPAAPVSQELVVVKKTQAITIGTLALKTVGDGDFDASASASSNLPVTYSSSNTSVATIVNGLIHIEGAGTTTITATQDGNYMYDAAAPVEQTLTVVKKTQTITFGTLPQKYVGDADFYANAQASSGLTVHYSSSNTSVAVVVNGLIHIVGMGTTTITAMQEGNYMFDAAASVEQTLNVVKMQQTITFNALGEKANGDADFDAGAVASSGLAVEYTSSNPEVATIINGKVHITGLGTTLIAASQPGNYMYEAAVTVVQILKVSDKKAPTQPQALTTTKTANGKVGLMWQASTDDIGVTGYYVFLNGKQLNAEPVTATSFVTDAPAGSLVYAYTVIAADAAGNLSLESATSLFTNSNGNGASNSTLEILKVFPNPSNGNFKVRLNSEETGSVIIAIYNADGVLVQSVSEGKDSNVYQREFKLQSVPKGMYLVKVAVGSFVQTSIVIIQ